MRKPKQPTTNTQEESNLWMEPAVWVLLLLFGVMSIVASHYIRKSKQAFLHESQIEVFTNGQGVWKAKIGTEERDGFRSEKAATDWAKSVIEQNNWIMADRIEEKKEKPEYRLPTEADRRIDKEKREEIEKQMTDWEKDLEAQGWIIVKATTP